MEVNVGAPLIIEYLKGGELVTKTQFENKNKGTKSKTLKVPKERSKSTSAETQPKTNEAVQCDGPVAMKIQYMKAGKLVTKDQFQDREINKEAIKSKDVHVSKGKDPKQIILEEKIANLEKQLCIQDKENETMEVHFCKLLKENKALRHKVKENEALRLKLDEKDLKIKSMESKIQDAKQTRMNHKMKTKELRRTITKQKEQLESKDLTIAKLTSQKLDEKPSEIVVSRPPVVNNVLVDEGKAVTTELFKTSKPVEENNSSNVNSIIKGIQTSLKPQQDTINDLEKDHRGDILQSFSHPDSSSIQVSTRLDSLETAINLLKHQLGAQNKELSQLRDICFTPNNAGTKFSDF